MKSLKKFAMMAMSLSIIGVFLPVYASADSLLWDQSSLGYSALISNTYFNVHAADDFQFSQGSNVTTLWWVGNSSSATSNLNGFNIGIYDNYFDAGLGFNRPGNIVKNYGNIPLASVTETTSGGNFSEFNLTLPSPFPAGANTPYWLSIQADTSDNGQPWWGWAIASTTNLSKSVYGSGSAFGNQIPVEYDLTYQLYGNAVPLPPTVFLLGSGLLGLAGWRRLRKR